MHSLLWGGLHPVREWLFNTAAFMPQSLCQAGCNWSSQASILGKIGDVCVKLDYLYKSVYWGKGCGVGFKERGRNQVVRRGKGIMELEVGRGFGEVEAKGNTVTFENALWKPATVETSRNTVL